VTSANVVAAPNTFGADHGNMDCNFGRAEVDDLGYKAYDAIEKL
jgi:hypothetical protein